MIRDSVVISDCDAVVRRGCSDTRQDKEQEEQQVNGPRGFVGVKGEKRFGERGENDHKQQLVSELVTRQVLSLL